MLHRFSTFEIDEGARELRAAGRVIEMQPRVFDLLVYLAKNRDRVVPKDELLESVWPGVIVSDGSLQRAVSLARFSLAEAGASDAIRTHARQGYRLRVDDLVESAANDTASAVVAARLAYERGDWDGTIATLKKVDALEGLTADDLQCWAHAAQCAGRPADAIVPLERAVAAYSARGDRRRAGWVAILIAQLRLEWRESALANGWLQRATRLLEGEPPCRETGYLNFLGARMALFNNDFETGLQLSHQAREAGEKFNDPDLESLGLLHAGEASLFLGKIREGLAAIDEAGVSVVASGLSSWTGGIIYCGVIHSCMGRSDWQRAGQWTEQYTRWCADKGGAGYPGLCRLHRAEVLTVRGQLGEAETEVRATVETLARQAPWAEGDAWRALGDVLFAKGDFTAAREAFGKANELGWESQFGLALLLLAEGDAGSAVRLFQRTLAENTWSTRVKRGQVLAWYAIASASAGNLDDARHALVEVETEPELTSTPALKALLARARGEVKAAEGRTAEAITLLREALRGWKDLAAPLAGAQARCRLAELLAADGDREAAALELKAAASAFQQAGAMRLLGSCDKLSRALTPERKRPGAKATTPRAK